MLSAGGAGVLFSPTLTPGGLSLVSTSSLPPPPAGLTIELFASFDAASLPASGGGGGLFSVLHRAPAFFGRGVSLTWEGNGKGEIKLLLEVSTVESEADGGGRGGLGTVSSPYFTPGANFAHIAGTYNGSHLSLYVNGSSVAATRACTEAQCGAVTWPLVDNLYVVTPVPVLIGAGGLGSSSHRGRILSARLLDTALSPSTMAIAARRDPVRAAATSSANALRHVGQNVPGAVVISLS